MVENLTAAERVDAFAVFEPFERRFRFTAELALERDGLILLDLLAFQWNNDLGCFVVVEHVSFSRYALTVFGQSLDGSVGFVLRCASGVLKEKNMKIFCATRGKV
jgi:hypothetical protein